MAFPLTPAETCVANTTVVHADLGNALQRALSGLFGGSISLRSVVIDHVSPGSGYAGPNSAPTGTSTAGTAKVSANGSSTNTTATMGVPVVARGEIYRGSVPLGWARIAADGSLLRGFNVKTVPGALGGPRHDIAGHYFVTFDVAPSDMDKTCVVASVKADGGFYGTSTATGSDGGFLSAEVSVWRLLTRSAHDDFAAPYTAAEGPALLDHEFSVIVFGE